MMGGCGLSAASQKRPTKRMPIVSWIASYESFLIDLLQG